MLEERIKKREKNRDKFASLASTARNQGKNSQMNLNNRKAMREGKFDFTDDGEIAKWAGIKVTLVPGDNSNIKITYSKDFEQAEMILNSTPGFERKRSPRHGIL